MMYEQMSYVYDELIGEAPYDDWLQFTIQLFEKHGIKGKHVADVGAGTGEMSLRLAALGYDVTGIDYSNNMLRIAEQKAQQKHLQINWIEQDLRRLTGSKEYDAVVSYLDVINYIVDESDVRQVFHNIYHVLKENGIFIFDVHAIDFITEYYVEETFTNIRDDAAYIWSCLPGQYPGEMYHDLTFFLKEPNGLYRKFTEYHHQRTYAIEIYKYLLKEVGFQNIEIYGDASIDMENSIEDAPRIFFLAKK